MTVRFQFRRANAGSFSSSTVLAAGEPGCEFVDIGGGAYRVRLKIGDGITPWYNLPYADQTGALPEIGVQSPLGLPALRGPGSPGLYGTSARRAREGWAEKATKPMNIVQVGDSTGVDWTASAAGLGFYSLFNTWMYQLAGQAEPVGYVSYNGNVNYGTKAPTFSGGTTANAENSGFGYGTRSITPPAKAASVFTCDRYWIFYPDQQFNGRFRVDDNAVTQATVIPVNTGGGTTHGSRIWDSGAVSLASHTIDTVATDGLGFPAIIEGIMFFNGNGNTSGSQGALSSANAQTGSGLRIFKSCHFGYNSTQFSSLSLGGMPWWQSITDGMTVPHLVQISLGINDMQVMVPGLYKTNLNTMVSNINTACTTAGKPIPSYEFIVPWHIGANSSTFPPFQEAMYESAEANNAMLVDMTQVTDFVGTAAADTGVIMAGTDPSGAKVHPNDLGHNLIARQLFAFNRDVVFGGVATAPTVTGAKGGNAALTNLLTQLAKRGLIVDSTT